MNMNLEIRQMRYVIAVAEELHFGRAAERLMIAQPPLSQQIKKVERQIGTELFHRTKRRVELTEAGRIFVEEARRTILHAELTLRATQRAARGEIGRLNIGYAGSAAHSILPRVMGRFRGRYPDVEIQLREMTTSEQLASLRSRQIDVGFVRPPVVEPDLRVTTLVEEQFLAVLPSKHPLARCGPVHLDRLSAERFIMFPRHMGPRLYDPIVAACQHAGFSPNVVQEAMHIPTIIGLVAAGVGIALLPESARELRWHGVIYRSLLNSSARTAIALAERRGDNAVVVKAFVEAAEQLTFGRSPATRARV
jgi:DNA-binding transcriptional LysR family regulator